MSDLPAALERLTARLDDLERRVGALEHRPASGGAPAPQPAAALSEPPPALPFSQAGAFPVLGKAMLGIAGAYLLRALMESFVAPKPLIAAIAIAYALLWLIAAARTSPEAWFARAAYACAASLIFTPMLWELTLRFNVLAPPAAAFVVCAFVSVAVGFTWKRPRVPVLWAANATAIALAFGLAAASHRLAPFLAALLFIALVAEWTKEWTSERGVRVVAAVAADLMIWALIYIYSSPASARADYPALGRVALLGPAIALFLIFASGVVFRTTFRGQRISAWETLQTTIAFMLAFAGVLRFGLPGGPRIFGIFCVLLSAAGYTAVFTLFREISGQRNQTVFGAWSAALLLAGCLLSLSPPWLAPCLCAASLAATALGTRLGCPALELHGLAYLVSAAAASGLLRYDLRALTGTMPGAPTFAISLVSLFAFLCYATLRSHPQEPRRQQALHLVFAAVGALAVMALLVQGLVGAFAFGARPEAHHLAFLRTFTLCLGALALAFAGARLRRLELGRVAYAVLALLAVKLVAEDLRHGHLEYVAASIFLFALTLLAVPRAACSGRQA